MTEAPARKWVCQAWHCGEVYEGTDRFCPTCRNVAAPQARIRRAGGLLIVLGLFLVGMMAALLWNLAPMMLAARQEIDGGRFSGSEGDGKVIIGLFLAIAAFGLCACVAGYIQLRHGRQNWKVVGGMLGVLTVICVIAWLIINGFLLKG